MCPGGNAANSSRQSSTKARSWQWVALMLKPMWKPGSSFPACPPRSSATWRISARVIGTISPERSAKGMNRSGRISPSRG